MLVGYYTCPLDTDLTEAMRVYRMLDKKNVCIWDPSSSCLVHPDLLEDEKRVAPTSVNSAKVMELLGVGSPQERVDIHSLLSRSCKSEGSSSSGEHSCDEDEHEDVPANRESAVALPHPPHPSHPTCVITTDVSNATLGKACMQSPVVKTPFAQELATSHRGLKLLKFQWLADMSVVLSNPNLFRKSSPLQLHIEKGENNNGVRQERIFPLPLPYPEKHLLPSPQRKDLLSVAHPLPQLLSSRSPSNQPNGSQVLDKEESMLCRLLSINELSSREGVPLPSTPQNGKAFQPSSLETSNQRLIASLASKSSSPSSSARKSSRLCHLLPSPPAGGGSTLNSPSPSPPSKPVCPRKWRKGAILGQGTFGIVHEGLNLEDGSFFAVKVSSTGDVSSDFQQEVDLLSKLEHPNIVRYLGSAIEDGRLCIFIELVRMGSLDAILRKYKRFEEKTIRSYTRQILQGLQYLHSQKTIHRDIKCANILVDVNGQVKLSDFGVAKQVGETLATSLKGTPLYMAPEVLTPRQNCYSFSADIWSLGCTVLEMADGKPPWSNLGGFGFLFKVKKGELPPIPEHLSPEGKDFLCSCLKFHAQDRPTASELLQHPFVSIISSPEPSILWAPLSLAPSFPSFTVNRPPPSSITPCTL